MCHTARKVFVGTRRSTGVDIVKGILEGIASAMVVGVSLWLWHRGKKYLDNQKRLERQIDELTAAQAKTAAHVADLQISEARWLDGTFDRSPEGQRIRHAAKEHATRVTASHSGGASVRR